MTLCRLLSALLLLAGSTAQQCPNSVNFVVFGGDFSAGTPGNFNYNPGRNSNGPVWVEILAPRSLINLATPGAVAYQPTNPTASSLATQMNTYLNTYGSFNAAQTAVVWIGMNDIYTALLNQNNPALVSPVINNVLNSVWASVNNAIARGLRTVFIGALPMPSLFPRVRATATNGPFLDDATRQYNTLLQNSINTYTGGPSGTRVIFFDGAGITNTLYSRAAAQGWTGLDPCQTAPVFNTPYNCLSPTTYTWFSGAGWTTNSHQILAQLLRDVICVYATGTRTPTPIPMPSPSPIPQASPIASPINRGDGGDGSDEGLLGLLGLLALPFCLCALYIPLLCLPLIMKKKKAALCCANTGADLPMAAPEVTYVETPVAYMSCPMN